ALAESGLDEATAAMREEVTDTFSAALAAPEVAEQVAAGRLVRAAHWAGCGPGIGTACGPTPAAASPPAPKREAAKREAAKPAAVDREAAEEKERAERERQRRAVSEAEQAVADASRQAEAAAAAEREVADSVVFMQERLNREQQRLAQAKRGPRHAPTAP